MKKINILLLLFLIITSCNPNFEKETNQNKIESMEQDSIKLDTNKRLVKQKNNLILEKSQSVPKLEKSQSVPELDINSGNFIMTCPEEMKINKIYDIFGLFSTSLDKKELSNHIKKLLEQHSSPKTTYKTEINDIIFHEYIELNLIDPTNDNFKINKIHIYDKQKIVEGKVIDNWHWKVLPLKVNPNTQLILKLIVYDTNNEISDNLTKTYIIEIKTSREFFIYEFINYLYKNPTWLLTTIIIPLIVFGYKNYRRKKDGKNKKN